MARASPRFWNGEPSTGHARTSRFVRRGPIIGNGGGHSRRDRDVTRRPRRGPERSTAFQRPGAGRAAANRHRGRMVVVARRRNFVSRGRAARCALRRAQRLSGSVPARQQSATDPWTRGRRRHCRGDGADFRPTQDCTRCCAARHGTGALVPGILRSCLWAAPGRHAADRAVDGRSAGAVTVTCAKCIARRPHLHSDPTESRSGRRWLCHGIREGPLCMRPH